MQRRGDAIADTGAPPADVLYAGELRAPPDAPEVAVALSYPGEAPRGWTGLISRVRRAAPAGAG